MKLRSCDGCGDTVKEILANDWASIKLAISSVSADNSYDVCSPACGELIFHKLRPDSAEENIGRWKWDTKNLRIHTRGVR